jgi:hypothetical protein
MSTIVVIVLAVVALALGIGGTLSSSEPEIKKAPDGVPYLNPQTYGKEKKGGTRLLIASSVVALTSTVISLIWK